MLGKIRGTAQRDVALDDILPHLLKALVGELLLSTANPRHELEYRFERHRLPDHLILIAGVIDTTTNYVEHPEVVADRIERAARAVGDPRRVMAGTDCGFETATGLAPIADEVVWENCERCARVRPSLYATPLWLKWFQCIYLI
jgi:5-methyltetrahydropteroyltriglutamate--homocysteine methyltransferase